MSSFLVVGYLNLEDTVYPGRPTVDLAPGGAALYAAAGAKVWASDVAIVTRVGDDYPPDYLDTMREHGINLDGLKSLPGPTMCGITKYLDDGSRQYVMKTPTERRVELAPAPEDLLPAGWKDVKSIHIATMTPEQQSGWLIALRNDVEFVSLDTDISFINTSREAVLELLGKTDAFFPNEEEACALFPGKYIPMAAEAIAAYGPRIVGIKLGVRGSHFYLADQDKHFDFPAFHVQAVDVTGAGDAFCGASMTCFARGRDVEWAGFRASATAALATANYGALELLSVKEEEVEKLIQTESRETANDRGS